MSSLPGTWRRQAYLRIKRFCELRLRGDLSENDIAEELGFGSHEAMRIQLKNWGLSGPLVMTIGPEARARGSARLARPER